MAADDTAAETLSLDTRAGWPGHPRIGVTAQFWLDRHAAFRRLGSALRLTLF